MSTPRRSRRRVGTQLLAAALILTTARLGAGAPGNLLSVAAPTLDSEPPKASPIADGDASVSTQTGAFQYTYPIPVPPPW